MNKNILLTIAILRCLPNTLQLDLPVPGQQWIRSRRSFSMPRLLSAEPSLRDKSGTRDASRMLLIPRLTCDHDRNQRRHYRPSDPRHHSTRDHDEERLAHCAGRKEHLRFRDATGRQMENGTYQIALSTPKQFQLLPLRDLETVHSPADSKESICHQDHSRTPKDIAQLPIL
jgi:hypothetical protein